jgi:hypothetical protein
MISKSSNEIKTKAFPLWLKRSEKPSKNYENWDINKIMRHTTNLCDKDAQLTKI